MPRMLGSWNLTDGAKDFVQVVASVKEKKLNWEKSKTVKVPSKSH